MYKLEINRGNNGQDKWEDDSLGDNTAESEQELLDVIPELARIIGCSETDFRVVEIK